MSIVLHVLKRMDTVVKGLQLVLSGAASNWWGLGRPSHCGAPSLPLLVALFLLGLSSGLLLSSILAAWFCFPLWQASSPSQVVHSEAQVARLRAYVHGRAAISGFRKRDH